MPTYFAAITNCCRTECELVYRDDLALVVQLALLGIAHELFEEDIV